MRPNPARAWCASLVAVAAATFAAAAQPATAPTSGPATKPAGFKAFEGPAERGYHAYEFTPVAKPLAPLFDEPLTDTSIARAPDGIWYLTGTAVADGRRAAAPRVTVWRSADRARWEVARQVDLGGRRGLSPEICFVGGRPFLTVGFEGGGTGLVSFASADVATAATTLAVVTKNGEDPSLFADDDGSLWWVTGGGTVAPLKPDPVQGLAGPAVRLRVPPVGGGKVQTDPSDVVGTHGAHLVKLNGWYHLFAADRPTRDGLGRLAVPGGTHDTYVAVARDVRGPYGPRYLAFPHAGQVTLCRDGDRWWAGYGGDDPAAALRHRPAMFPVDLAATPKPVAAGSAYAAGFIVRPSGGVIFEAGPVARLAAGRLEQAPGSREVLVRDPFVARLPDGSYRLTGTAAPDGVAMWRSDDLLDWKLVGVVWRFPDDPAAWFNATTGRALWAPELHRVGDDYFIPFSAGNVLSNGLLRSTTGRPEGPYEPTRRDAPLAKWIDSSLFRDADGRLYLVWQSGNLAELNADRSALAGPVRPLRTVDGAKVGYEGVQLVRVGGWYVLTAAEWHGDLRAHGTYDMMYAVSRTLAGPYSRARLAVPHGGHGMLFQDRDGRWRATLFGNDRTAPFRKLPGVVPMDVRDTGDDLILRPADADGPAR